MSLKPRPEINSLCVCPHGGLEYGELLALGIHPEKVLDFSVCTNPFMPPPQIKEIRLGSMAVEHYPDSEVTELRYKLAQKLGIPPEIILMGSGSTELIRLVTLTYLRPGDSVLILEPTYGEYEVASKIAGAVVVKQRIKAEDGFLPQVEMTLALIKQYKPRVVFICNPNNPTGKYLSRQELEMLCDSIVDGLLVLDEAYLAFVEGIWPSTDLVLRGNTVILRSMTKDFGLSGLRLGYAIASREIIDSLRLVCPPWNVNIVAQKVGAMVLEDVSYFEQTRQKIKEAKQFLVSELSLFGYSLHSSDTHYFLVQVGNAKMFRTVLLEHGIQVRDCRSFGLPDYIRIGTRTLPECKILISTIMEIKNKGDFK
ncbi:pyridoxal phosphate-dependent aminotransferase [Chloroflexota bacterium]